MSTSAELTAQVGTAVAELNTAKNRFEAIREETEQKVRAATEVVPGILSLTLYVNASTGNDETGKGSSALPYKTIKKAIESTAPICRLVLILAGSSAETKHLIDQTISIGSRIVEIRCGRQHILLSDALRVVFVCGHLGCVHFSDASGGVGEGACYVYSSGFDKLLVEARGKASLHLGGYYGVNWCSSDETALTLMKSAYRWYARGFCEITLSRFWHKNFDNTAPAESLFTAFDMDEAGSALYNVWETSLGNNVRDTSRSSVVLAGSSKLLTR